MSPSSDVISDSLTESASVHTGPPDLSTTSDGSLPPSSSASLDDLGQLTTAQPAISTEASNSLPNTPPSDTTRDAIGQLLTDPPVSSSSYQNTDAPPASSSDRITHPPSSSTTAYTTDPPASSTTVHVTDPPSSFTTVDTTDPPLSSTDAPVLQVTTSAPSDSEQLPSPFQEPSPSRSPRRRRFTIAEYVTNVGHHHQCTCGFRRAHFFSRRCYKRIPRSPDMVASCKKEPPDAIIDVSYASPIAQTSLRCSWS
eukprot:g3530.t1